MGHGARQKSQGPELHGLTPNATIIKFDFNDHFSEKLIFL